MKIRINNEIKHSLLIEFEDLNSIYEFVKSNYSDVEIDFRCTDGSQIETKDITEVEKFENVNYRKIRSFSLIANDEKIGKAEIFLWDDKGEITSEITINSSDDVKAQYINTELKQKVREMRPWYSFLTRISIFHIFGVLGLIWLLIRTPIMLLDSAYFSQKTVNYPLIESINIFLFFFIIYLAILFPLEFIKRKLFPKVFFLIGKQIKKYEMIKFCRSIIFVGIILAIVVGIIANIISHWIMN